MRSWAALPAGLLVLLAGCSSTAPSVTVTVAGQSERLSPTQYCLSGDAEFYPEAERPPVLRVGADEPILVEVPAKVAEAGWQIQVFDAALEEQIGQVDAFDELTTSDAVPAEFYLVVVQDAGSDCEGLSGAWPIGLVRGG